MHTDFDIRVNPEYGTSYQPVFIMEVPKFQN